MILTLAHEPFLQRRAPFGKRFPVASYRLPISEHIVQSQCYGLSAFFLNICREWVRQRPCDDAKSNTEVNTQVVQGVNFKDGLQEEVHRVAA